jgi:hypothetical protein
MLKRLCPNPVIFPMSSSNPGWMKMSRPCAASKKARELVFGCQCGAGGLRTSGRGVSRRVRHGLRQWMDIDDQPIRDFRSYKKPSPTSRSSFARLGAPAHHACRGPRRLDNGSPRSFWPGERPSGSFHRCRVGADAADFGRWRLRRGDENGFLWVGRDNAGRFPGAGTCRPAVEVKENPDAAIPGRCSCFNIEQTDSVRFLRSAVSIWCK